MEVINYWDKNYHLHPHKTKYSENGILYAFYYHLLYKQFHKHLYELKIGLALSSFRDNPYNLSHDNVTAYKCLYLFMFRKPSTHRFAHWHRRVHPRDIIFWRMLESSIFRFLAIIPAIAMVISCFRSREHTSSKLLAWSRLEIVNMPLTKRICDYLIKRTHGSWSDVFAIYFKDTNHPCNVLARSLYGK